MKKILKQLEVLQVTLEEKIATREEYFDNKSEKWQESERGEAFQERTGRLSEMMDEVIDWQADLGSDL